MYRSIGGRVSARPLDVAIVGLAGCYADAPDARAFWHNILAKIDAVRDADPDWAGSSFDPDGFADNRTYTIKGGFLRELAEVSLAELGVLPSIADGGDPDHLMALKYARNALLDAGYLDGRRSFVPERAGVVIGRGTYGNRAMAGVLGRGLFLDQAMAIAIALRPDLSTADLEELRQHFRSQLPPFSADMVGPTTPNVVAGLIANRLNLMGPNYIVDAACASTLFALDCAIRELSSDRCDLMLTGGVQAHTPAQLYIQFSQIHALSHDRIRPFQKGANGILLGEGVGMLVLKRLADAERDGDRIYAVIKGVGIASDGKAKGLLAPRLEGQVLALQLAYQSSGIDPLTVDLIEAHGTGTAAGDQTEIVLLNTIFGGRGDEPLIALGSVKSMIGHCLPAAGSASLIKTALALFHKVIPPTLCDEPDPELFKPGTPLYINNQVRPWIHGKAHPRRAGVNAFGFGGANAHVVLEEYVGSPDIQPTGHYAPQHSELITLAAPSIPDLLRLAERVLTHLSVEGGVTVAEIAKASSHHAFGMHRVAIVAVGLSDLAMKVRFTIQTLKAGQTGDFSGQAGVLYGAGQAPGKVCFMFPGEGAQCSQMLADLCMEFPKVRECFDALETTAEQHGLTARAPILFPCVTGWTLHQSQRLEDRRLDPGLAIEAVVVASIAMQQLLDDIGIKADAMLGYSAGEITAITARTGKGSVARIEQARTVIDLITAKDVTESGSLLIADALWPETRTDLLAKLGEDGSQVYLVADDCPNTMTLSGPKIQLQALKRWLENAGSIATEKVANTALHTPRAQYLVNILRRQIEQLEWDEQGPVVYSACTAAPLSTALASARDEIADQWQKPVRFAATVQRLYEDGYRIFVEVGPASPLPTFVSDILHECPDALAVPNRRNGHPDVRQFREVLAQLFVSGVAMTPEVLYAHRDIGSIDLDGTPRSTAKPGVKLKLRMPVLSVPSGWKPMPAST